MSPCSKNCQDYSNVASVPSRCSCKSGYAGSVALSTSIPFSTSTCSAVTYPAISLAVYSGRCSGVGIYAGSVSASTSSPIFTSACSALTCLVNSEGASVPSDTHTMQAMLDTWQHPPPSHLAVTYRTNSNEASAPRDCSCNAGYVVSPFVPMTFFAGSCPAVSCPLNSDRTGVPSGSPCKCWLCAIKGCSYK
jgi:hypothetical protein